MQIGIPVLVFALCAICNRSSLPDSPKAAAQTFCNLEITGIGLSGETSRPLLELTIGEEEPFTDQSEIASQCKIVEARSLSATAADVIVEYHVVGKIKEDDAGLKHIVSVDRAEKNRIRVLLSEGTWKISRRSLALVPVHANAGAWAKNFEEILEGSDKSHPDVDRNLEEIIAQLKRM